MITKLLVANRGEIAVRVFRTCRLMGIEPVAVFTPQDAGMPHTVEVEAVEIDDYLNLSAVIAAALSVGAQAIHPGYGFLSEKASFARGCASAGLIFIGPPPEAMDALGDKSTARATATKLGVPIAEGLGPFSDVLEIEAAIRALDAPVMLKAAAGGGGKGMKKILSLVDLPDLIASSQRESLAAFSDDRMIVERYIYPARHVEVQIFGDGKRCIALGERECSLQRRHQKILEESPSTAVDDELREKLFDCARRICESVGYANAGTCEFLLGPDGGFYFLEVNARLQVEHPVTEMCTGLDLVRMQIEVAQGMPLMKQEDVVRSGHAIEVRLCAEDPWNHYLPSAGKVLRCYMPKPTVLSNIRCDYAIGSNASSSYDSLLAKIIAHSSTRNQTIGHLSEALKMAMMLGIETNKELLSQIVQSDWLETGMTFTHTLDELDIGKRFVPDQLMMAAAAIFQGPPIISDSASAVPPGWGRA